MLRIAYPRSSEGPSPETCRRRSGEWRPAAAARNQGPGRSGTPPAMHYDLAARSSLHKSGRNAGDGSAAPDRKSPRWSAERRARPAGRAPRLRKRGPSRPTARQQKYCAFSALHSPLIGVDGKEKSKTRAQKRAAGTRETVLLDVVRHEVPHAHPTIRLILRRRRSRRLEGWAARADLGFTRESAIADLRCPSCFETPLRGSSA